MKEVKKPRENLKTRTSEITLKHQESISFRKDKAKIECLIPVKTVAIVSP